MGQLNLQALALWRKIYGMHVCGALNQVRFRNATVKMRCMTINRCISTTNLWLWIGNRTFGLVALFLW